MRDHDDVWSRVGQDALVVARHCLTGVLECRHARLEKEGSLPGRWYYDPLYGQADWEGSQATVSWVPIRELHQTKQAEGPAPMRPILSAMQMVENPFNKAVFGGPTPLATTLAGGLIGAGLGYGGGKLIEHLLGEDVLKPGSVSRLGLLLGGTAGTMPGMWLASTGARMNHQEGKNPYKAWVEPNRLYGTPNEMPKEGSQKSAFDDSFPDAAGLAFMPTIPTDSFGRVVWQDPNTPPAIRAATTGLVESAGALRGAQVVSPFDVAKVALGMGSGLASGLVVGKVLGALAGLTPPAQKTLQQTGMWAGALMNIIPKAFGVG